MSLWLTDIVVRPSQPPGQATPPHERRVADVMGPALPADPAVVHTVIDGRPPGARTGSTANYRLQRALGLPRAAPVACWSPDLESAVSTLDLLLDTVPDDRCALLLAGGLDPPHPLAIGLVWRRPARPGLPPLDPAELPEHDAGEHHGNGFLALLTAAARGEPPTRTCAPQATREGTAT